MSTNLWNTQSPKKRIDLYFKIDDYKKHLLSLKNVKSTFTLKQSPSSFFPKHNQSNRSQIFSKKTTKPLLKGTCNKLKQNHVNKKKQQNLTCRQSTNPAVSTIQNSRIIDCDSSLDYGRMNSSMIFVGGLKKNFVNFREWQINEDNKKILKKLQEVRASPQLSMKKLSHKYSISDLKYKMNLQKARYKNIDFTKAAQQLLKGQKIKFKNIRMGSMEMERVTSKERIKISEINLNWQLSKKMIQDEEEENRTLIKDLG